MDKCPECGERCNQDRIVLEHGGERTIFCSLECVIIHAVARLRRRISRRNRRVQGYAQAKMSCQTIRARRSSKASVRL